MLYDASSVEGGSEGEEKGSLGMDKPTCESCPYFVRDSDPATGFGTCHRHAPQPRSGFFQWNDNESDCEETYGYFASIAFFDFCGEHPDFPAWIESQRKEHK